MDKNEMRINILERAVEKNVGEDLTTLQAFFEHIIYEDYDYIIFISRRCYILFQIFATIKEWSLDTIITDLGIFANKNKLLNCENIIVVDDIGYTGKSMRKVLNRIKLYVSPKCKISAVLYAVNKKTADAALNIKINPLKKIGVKCRLQLTNHQCYELSTKLMKLILDSGMPYTTFVYPIWGEIKKDISNDYSLLSLNNELMKSKWKTSYINIINESKVKWINYISKYSCIRVYTEPTEKKNVLLLPFSFLRSVKSEKIDLWYSNVAQIFQELGKVELAKEIRSALNVKRKWRKDAIEYLGTMMSCFCSKAISEILELEKYISVQEINIEDSFKGSFSDDVLEILKNCDSEFAKSFFENFINTIGDVESCFCEDGKNMNELQEFIMNKYADLNVFEMTRSVYMWLKNQRNMTAVTLDDIVRVLEEQAHYDSEEIYLAQIECWDIGIATYRFNYNKKNGLVAECSAGEISSLISTLRYQDLIQEFYKIILDNEQNKTRTEVLDNILDKAINEKKYTEKELTEFKRIVSERKGSLYGLLI